MNDSNPSPGSLIQPGTLSEAAKALRSLFAWALLGYTALHLTFEFLRWAVPDGSSLAARSRASSFDSLFIMAMPLVAVLIVSQISPVLRAARLMTAVALIEYVVALAFTALTFMIGIGDFRGVHNARQALDLLQHVVFTFANIALIGLCALLALRVYLALGGRLPEVNLPKSG